MSVMDWLKATAEWMHKDRPDLYKTASAAMQDLDGWMESMRKNGNYQLSTGGFRLDRFNEDGLETWELSKIISSATVDYETGDVDVSGWTRGSGTLAHGVDLPDVSEGIEDDWF